MGSDDGFDPEAVEELPRGFFDVVVFVDRWIAACERF